MLNIVYKIFAKALGRRLQPLLNGIIHTSQTSFIKERSILDNLFAFWEMTVSAKKKKHKLVVLLLDFEKAYDRVNWTFLKGVLERMGFSQK